MSKALEEALGLLHTKRINFTTFVHRTRLDFARLAKSLLRRWRTPEWFSEDDVTQELYIGVSKCLWKYDPLKAKGNSLLRFVVFNSMAWAKQQLHLARGVTISGSPDKKISQIEKPLSSFVLEGENSSFIDALIFDAPIAEEIIITEEQRREKCDRVYDTCETITERLVVSAIVKSGSLDAAGRFLYEDFDLRIYLRLPSEEHADRFAHHHARIVASRLDALAIFGGG